MNTFSAGRVYHGFSWKNSREIPEIAATAHVFFHLKTGARLLYLESEDVNKVFGIGFRTPPHDSTGVAHIVEHCVLSGSRKYKTKEPFMDLIKSSLQTFLNAMTFPDKTIYPVASRNDQDFKNLTDVYLDAVFYPAIYEDGRIFDQEGWHYELNPATEGGATLETLSLSGVVYNEMKGVYSNPISILYNEVMAGLYPDTPYGHDSGGNPEAIPHLTKEAFLDFHRRYYHPSNSYIYFYGKLDIMDRLAYLDQEYLSRFDLRVIDSAVSIQAPPVKPVKRTANYAVPAGTETKGKFYYAWATCLPPDLDLVDRMRLEILCDVLFENSASPVREALLKAGLGEDVFGFNEHLRQGFLGLGLVNGGAGTGERFVQTIEQVLANQAAGALDRQSLVAGINKMEYALREADGATNRGVAYFMKAFETWLYDGDPAEALGFAEALKSLRQDVDKGRYEETIREFFLDRPHKLYLTLVPEPGLNESREQALQAQLKDRLAAFTETQKNQLRRSLADFRQWQQQPDSQTALATIPRLKKSDINRDILSYQKEEKNLGGCPALGISYHAPGILYLRLAFDLGHLTVEEAAEAALLVPLLNELDSKKHSYRDLQTAIDLTSGGINHSLQVLYHEPTRESRLYYVISLKSTPDQWEGALAILEEVLKETCFTDRKRACEIWGACRVSLEQMLMNNSAPAMIRAMAGYDEGAALKDRLGGFTFYDNLCALLNCPAADQEEALAQMKGLLGRLVYRDRLTLALTAEPGPECDRAEAALEAFLNRLPQQTEREKRRLKATPFGVKSEAFAAASQVQYVVQSFSCLMPGETYKGQMTVASTLLSRGYLHDRIRARGGAYGAGLSLSRNGAVAAYSYRDPRLEETLAVYAEAGRDFSHSLPEEEQIEDAVMASMNSFDTVLTPATVGATALNLYLSGLTKADVLKNMEEAIATRKEDLARFGSLIDTGFNGKGRNTVVVGGIEKIKSAADCFDCIYEVTEKGLKQI